ncbi:radical SAM family heme chaperone HemW [Massilia sp. W12]|uniref:radical SAM family heme chaperone HemW n=1 Tax=Massilia sp. W12 TaxID=3126507 RepID=UPI0030D29644
MIPILPEGAAKPDAQASPADAAHAGAAQAAQAWLKQGSLQLRSLPPLSLYVHFPWCVRKCPYCDFNSHEAKNGIPEAEYLAALRRDLELALPLIWGRPIHSVFIGGGTPSLLSAAGMERLMSDLRSLLPLAPDVEITMEANPGTFEAEKFAAFRQLGVNRLSIGVQSFDSAKLHALGRIHDGEQARAALEIASRHFDNFNLDLMFALPGQSLAELQEDLAQALSWRPPHLSYYHLTLEPNTLFAKFPPDLPDDDLSADMQELIFAQTAAAGLAHYEVSAYARPDCQARHNRNYWEFGDYLGIGPGAHSKLSFAHRIVRQMRYKQPQTWITQCQAGAPLQQEHEVGRDELGFEFMLNALRLEDGFALNLFAERTGLPLSVIDAALQDAQRRGLLEVDHRWIKPSPLGKRFLNDLQQLFLHDA